MVEHKHGDFGGDWTEEKLKRLEKYLPAYTNVLKGRVYKYAYIDAFAGAGYRVAQRKQAATQDLWGEDLDERGRRFTEGSAVVAILFPAGIGVNRQLPRDGNVPEWARTAFTRLFGTPKWYDRFYEKHATDDMFGGADRLQKVGSSGDIVAFYRERLEEIFPHVAPNPLVLCNSNNAPMFALFFAAAHPIYGATGVKIAQDVLGA